MSCRVAIALVAAALASTVAGAASASESWDGGWGPDALAGDAPADAASVEAAPPDATTPETAPPSPAPAADEDEDLGLIPSELREELVPSVAPAPPAPSPARSRIEKKLFGEDAFTLASPERAVTVPYPGTPPRWQNRTSFDLYLRAGPWRKLTLTLSNRLSVIEQDGLTLLSRHTVQNHLREAYATWELAAATYFEIGRINLRHGAALGFGPTDFFKTRTLVGQASLDPSAMRQNRLGTLMARAQKIWSGGSLSLAYAPKVAQPSAILRSDRWGVDPAFDATNAAHRALAVVGLDLRDWSAQLLGYYERHRAKLGCNLTRPFGDAVIAYAEWAGGPEQNLITRGLAYGQSTGVLPADLPPPWPTDTGTAFRNDVAAGASWNIARKVTLNLEYHFHQSGFTRQDWRNWFDVGSSGAAAPLLWYLRGYASDQQEPLTRHQVFVRGDWPRGAGSRLAWSGFALVDLLDGSTLAQALLSTYPSDAWTIALYGSLSVGAARSERGSLPQWGNVVLQIARYL